MPSDQPIANGERVRVLGDAEQGYRIYVDGRCQWKKLEAAKDAAALFCSGMEAEAQVAALTQQLADEIAKGLANEKQIRTDAQGKIEALRTEIERLGEGQKHLAHLLCEEEAAYTRMRGIVESLITASQGCSCMDASDTCCPVAIARAALTPVAQPSAEGTEAADENEDSKRR